jgi:carbonic anhydrase
MLKSNEAWANYKAHQHTNFFQKMADVEVPRILWLGCSDSRMPETTILGLQPGDVMSHRNAGNIIIPSDLNTSAVIEYAIHVLNVCRIVLCGHTDCGFMASALSNVRIGGVLEQWIAPLKILIRSNKAELESKDGYDDLNRSVNRLAELNVQMGIYALFRDHGVETAIREKGLRIHGVMYDVRSGKIRDLGFGNSKFSLEDTNHLGADPMLRRLWQ